MCPEAQSFGVDLPTEAERRLEVADEDVVLQQDVPHQIERVARPPCMIDHVIVMGERYIAYCPDLHDLTPLCSGRGTILLANMYFPEFSLDIPSTYS